MGIRQPRALRAGPSLRSAPPAPLPRVHRRGDRDARARHRRQHRDSLGRRRDPPPPARVRRPRRPRRAAAPRLQPRRSRQLSRLEGPHPFVSEHGRGRCLVGEPDGRKRSREALGDPDDAGDFSDARHRARARPVLRRLRGAGRKGPRRRDLRRPLAAALRRRSGPPRPDHVAQRRALYGRRRDASRLRVRSLLGDRRGDVGAARLSARRASREGSSLRLFARLRPASRSRRRGRRSPR